MKPPATNRSIPLRGYVARAYRPFSRTWSPRAAGDSAKRMTKGRKKKTHPLRKRFSGAPLTLLHALGVRMPPSPSPWPSPLGRGGAVVRVLPCWACGDCSGIGRSGSLSLGRNDAIEVWVERATGPFCRVTSPTVERTAHSRNGERSWCARLGGRLPPRTAKLAVPPRPIASFRLGERAGVRGKGRLGVSRRGSRS
jgi:hypothetical protein